MRVAVFDLDGTITRHDTLWPYLRGWVRRHRRPAFWPRVLAALVPYLIDRDRGELKARLIRTAMGGASRADVRAWTAEYVALLGTLGFFIDTVLYIALLTRTGRYRRWPVIVVVAFAGALAFMAVFMRVVYLSLPIGRPPFSAVSLALMQLMGIR